MMTTETAQQELRTELIDDANKAIGTVRDIVAKLNEREKDYLRNNSPTYRQLVDTIKNWKST